ncbi:PQQ-dependent sugar dehydrogenase [Haladaptatus halobius]|uniref:PQQ-dependent sugar dehydrogenase n=1 Tax=Haladaptatus halobius TaxID=2884875 RepID=UPI001D09A792|nr:PQQ-dependent sugar dehydrogenase [Haladaptatus halobius]
MVTLGKFAGTYADPNQKYDERGLLGLDFHPNFRNNRKFYVHYSAPRTKDMPKNWDHIEVISEFKATQDLSSGDPNSERKLLQIESPQYNHDSGPMAFSSDGYLYIPMGDGGGADDDMYGHVSDWYRRNKGGNGQDVTQNLLGSIIRIDVDNQENGKPYAIPDDNPLVNTQGRDELYAWGFRNPFGISFDSQDNMFVADAGQNLYEEADIVQKGGNYGWNVKEGTHCFSTKNPTSPPNQCPSTTPNNVRNSEPLIDPIVEFPHTYKGTSVGITIIGGHRYENKTISGLQGKYVFGAWTKDPARQQPAGRLLAAAPRQDGGNKKQTLSPPKNAIPRKQLWKMEELQINGQFNYFVRMFGRDRNGELYVLANKRGIPAGNTGTVLKLVPPGQ